MNGNIWIALGPWVLFIIVVISLEYLSDSRRKKYRRYRKREESKCKFRTESGGCSKDCADQCDHDGIECCLVNGRRPEAA